LLASDHKDDYDNLTRALELSKEIAKDVDEQVQAQQRQQLLLEIQEKTDAKSSTTYKGICYLTNLQLFCLPEFG